MVSKATLNIIEKVLKGKEPLADVATEEPEKKIEKSFICCICYMYAYYSVITDIAKARLCIAYVCVFVTISVV